MKREVVWTVRAEKDLSRINQYLAEKWGAVALRGFNKKLVSKIEVISRMPFSFPYHDKERGIIRCRISKQVSLYYTATEGQIKLLTLYESKRDLGKLGY